MDRIPPPAKQAGLRTVTIKRDAERKCLASAHEAGSAYYVFRRDMVEGADAIIFAPTSPVT
jgi:hypothetical protein